MELFSFDKIVLIVYNIISYNIINGNINDSIKDIFEASLNGEIKFKYNNDLINYFNSLYNSCRILSIFYSCLTLLVIYKILKEFNLKDITLYIILLMMATQPVLVMMSGTMNNDNLSYLFFFSALLFAIKWFKNDGYLNIIMIKSLTR